jgi:HEAT repeat protein
VDIQTILADKQLKAKPKVEAISKMLIDKKVSIGEVVKIARLSKDKEKGTCIESLEFATRTKPEIASPAVLDFVAESLTDEAPRVKWESAKVIGNIANLFPARLDTAISNLLANTESSGTVVRWSAAFALGEIIKLKTKRNKDLIPAVESIIKREEDNAIKKIYQKALKKVMES